MTNIRSMQLEGIVSADNSSVTPLIAAAEFTGVAVDILDYQTIFINVYADVASAEDGLIVEQSSDGVNWDHDDKFTIAAGSSKNFSINPYAQYLRVRYINGGTGQTTFRLQTILKANSLPSSHRIQDLISTDDDAELVKAVLAGESPDGQFRNVTTNLNGNLNVSVDSFGDTPILDAFGRLRVSNPLTILEEKNISVSPVLGNKGENGGSVAYQALKSSFLLTSGTNAAGKATRQTRQRATYQPGKSQLIDITFTAAGDTEADTIQRIGYFDDKNGLFFEINGNDDLYMVIRSDTTGSVVDTKIARSNWQDPLDGTGPSGLTLDLTKSQILQIDFQWLGVGRARFGFVINGLPVLAYNNNWANFEAGVYMRNPNLPIRWQVENDGSTTGVSLEAICATVQSEGGFAARGLVLGFDNAEDGKSVSNGQYGEVLAVRLTSDNIEKGAAFPVGASAICASAGDFLVEFWLNPTGMSDGPDGWTQPSGSMLEYAYDRTGSYTGGVKVGSYFSANQNSGLAAVKEAFSLIGLGYDIFTDTADVIAIRVRAYSNETFYASLNIRQEA